MKGQDEWRIALLKLLELLTAAVAALKEVLFETAGDSEGSDAVAAAGVEADRLRRQFVQQWAAEIDAAGYLTNDIVDLDGEFGPGAKALKINSIRLSLTQGEFVLLYILLGHARTRAGLQTPRRVEGGKFLSVRRIIEEIDALRREQPSLAEFWENATSNDVHGWVCDLRKKIFDAGGNPKLIQSGPPGEGGYRLSTPPFNATTPR